MSFSGTGLVQVTRPGRNGGNATTTTASLMLARDDAGDTYIAATWTPTNGSNPQTQTVIYIHNVAAGADYTLYPARAQAVERMLPKPRNSNASTQPGNDAPWGGRGFRGNRPQPTITQLPDQNFLAGTLSDVPGTQITITMPGRNGGTGMTTTTTEYYSSQADVLASETRTGPNGASAAYTIQSYTPGAPSVSFTPPSNYSIFPASELRGGRG